MVERRLAERVGLVDVRAAIDEQDGDRFVAARFGDQAVVSRRHTGDAGGGEEQRALAGRRRIVEPGGGREQQPGRLGIAFTRREHAAA